ncbi:MAG: hypothetical protein AB7N76_10255 [Planctomycetota bacterium]
MRLGLLLPEDEQSEVLHRTWERAYARVERLEQKGWDTVELEGRLLAARALELRGEPRAGLQLVEEVLVLAKTMAEVGDPPPEAQSLERAFPKEELLEEVERRLEVERERTREAAAREAEALRILLEEELEALREQDLAALRYEGRRERERELEATESWLEANLEAATARQVAAQREQAKLEQQARSAALEELLRTVRGERAAALTTLEHDLLGRAAAERSALAHELLARAAAQRAEAEQGLLERIAAERAAALGELGTKVGAEREAALEELQQELLARLASVGERMREERTKALELRLAAFLAEERFQVAAAEAAAARPQALLDRPETLARIDAVASRLDERILERADLREAIDAGARGVVERFVRGGHLARLVEPLLAELGVGALEPRLEALERGLRARLGEVEGKLAAAGLAPDEARRLAREEATRLLGEERERARAELTHAVRRELSALHGEEAFTTRVAEAVAAAVAAPEQVARVRRAVLESDALVPRVLDDEGFGRRLHDALGKLLRSKGLAERFRELLEEGLPTSAALRQALIDGIEDDEAAGAAVDERIDERVHEKSQELLDQSVLRRKITVAVREEMVEEVFLKNVDARVSELAAEGALAERIRELIAEGVKPAVDAAMSGSDSLRRLVAKELTNREALKTAQLTGDGLSDPSTAIVRSEAFQKLLEEQVRAALRDKRRWRPPTVGLKGPSDEEGEEGAEEAPPKPKGGPPTLRRTPREKPDSARGPESKRPSEPPKPPKRPPRPQG